MAQLSEERPLPYLVVLILYYLACSIAAMAVLSNPEKGVIPADRMKTLREKYKSRP